MADRTQPKALRRAVELFDRLPLWSLSLFAGLLVGLGHAPFGLWWASVIGLILVGWVFAQARSARAAAFHAWLAVTASYALSLHWLIEPFLVDAARHAWMSPFALFAMASGLALFWALAAGLVRRFGNSALLYGVSLALAELARGHVFTGFPWNLVGYIWIDTPLSVAAAWIGPYGLTALTLLATVPCGVLLARRRRAGAVLVPVVGALLSLLPWLVAPAQMGPPTGKTIRLVQPNAPQHLKWHPDHAPVFFARAIEFTAAPPAHGVAPDLIVWPETSVPVLLDYAGSALQHISDKASGVPVIAGVQRRGGTEDYFNAMIRIDAGGQVGAVYDKHHLVPFGEYIPLQSWLGALGLSGLADQIGGGYTPGPAPGLFDTGGAGQAMPMICYEAVFPGHIHAAAERPEFLLQITNDAWFGQFSGPYQHLVQARFRAIEQGLPLLRAANTGVSAVISPTGAVLARLDMGQAGFLDAALPAPAPATLYARTGDLPLSVALMLVAASLSGWRRQKRD